MGKIRVDEYEWNKYKEFHDRRAHRRVEIINEFRAEETAKRKAILNNVVDVLGLREVYPDVKTTKSRIVGVVGLYGVVPEDRSITVTDYGVDRFEKDLEAAASAAKGGEALAKIQAALKGKK